MMSNGPWSPERSLQAGSRTICAAATSAVPRSTNTRRNPSRSSRLSERESDECCRLTTRAPISRSARAAFRCAQTFSGMSSTMATGST